MKWSIFSRKKGKKNWRLIFKPQGDVADIMALPGSVVEGRIAGRYLLSNTRFQSTVIIQGVNKKGFLAGVDVSVDKEAAEKYQIDVAYQPRSGRSGLYPAGTISFDEMVLKASDRFETYPNDPEDLACIIYTSGTTGVPKGVMLSRKNFIKVQEATQKVIKVRKGDQIVGVLPFFHVFGLSNVLITGLVHGATILLVPQYSPTTLLKTITENNISFLMAIPTMFIHLVRLLSRKVSRFPDSIRLCVSGGAPLPDEVKKKFKEITGLKLIEGYGLTETTSSCCLNPPEGVSKPGSIGLPLPGIKMKVCDEAGNELPPGKTGEIAVKSESVMMGYYNLPHETEESIKDGWLFTGDLGYRDDEGYFFITDRKKEIIIKGGLNISPREIEEVLLSYPAVKEAAVLGRKKGEREEIVAFVVANEGTKEKEIMNYCKGHLASFKVPDTIQFRDVLPKSITGKIMKKELKDGYRDRRKIERGV